MVCVLLHLFSGAILFELSASLSSSAGTEPALSCQPQWFLLRQKCFAFYPVWSSWSDANSMCSQSGGNLMSLHTPEERQFVVEVTNITTPVWLGGYQGPQNDSLFWIDNASFSISRWLDKRRGEAGACIEMIPKGGELHSARCRELKFYICSKRASSTVCNSTTEKKEPGILPGVDLFDVVWSQSELVAEEILHSSCFLRQLRTGHMSQNLYHSFMKQEALYLNRIGSTLKVLIRSLKEAGDIRSLLEHTLKLYSSRNQSLLASSPPQCLHYSFQSFHSVVLEEPVYWLVALSAKASLHYFLAQELLKEPVMLGSTTDSFYQEWSRDSLKEVTWIQRYKNVIKENQNQMDVFKAINIFREQMMSLKSFYKAVDCEAEDGV